MWQVEYSPTPCIMYHQKKQQTTLIYDDCATADQLSEQLVQFNVLLTHNRSFPG